MASAESLRLETSRWSIGSEEDLYKTTSNTTSCSTPASSLYSDDWELSEAKPRQKSTVIHEEEAESPSATAIVAESPILPLPAPLRVLQPVEHELPYTHANMPWDRFYTSRADYPRSMFDLFLDYHRGPLSTLHDLGAGSGLAADGALTALRARTTGALPRVILSDPGEENMGITSRFVAARHPDANLECWQAVGEHQDQFLVPGSVDMTICAEALHWMDMDSVVPQVANSLRPGGTFAVVLYSCFPRVLNNARVKKLLRALVEHHVGSRLLNEPVPSRCSSISSASYWSDDLDDLDSVSPNSSQPTSPTSPNSPTNAHVHPNWARGMRALAYGLDAVDLPADQWEDIKRHEVNCGATGWWWPNASKDALGCMTPMADASPHERLVYESYEDWGRWSGVRELKELLLSIQVGFGEKTWESPLWKELERVAKEPLNSVWQVHMITARKKCSGLKTVPERS